jgi:hypothetical protein
MDPLGEYVLSHGQSCLRFRTCQETHKEQSIAVSEEGKL